VATFIEVQKFVNDQPATTSALPGFVATAGNAIIVVVSSYTAGGGIPVSSISDTAGNTYTACGTPVGIDANHMMEVWCAKNITGNASNVVTITHDGSAVYRKTAVLHYSGLATDTLYDATSTFSTSSSGTTHTTSSVSTSIAGNLLINFFILAGGSAGTVTGSGDTTVREGSIQSVGNGVADLTAGAAGSYSSTVTTGSNCQLAQILKSFNVTATGSPPEHPPAATSRYLHLLIR
jgi:hypothetical protein